MDVHQIEAMVVYRCEESVGLCETNKLRTSELVHHPPPREHEGMGGGSDHLHGGGIGIR
jgi:hypothetical protein